MTTYIDFCMQDSDLIKMQTMPPNQDLIDNQMYDDESSMFSRNRFLQKLNKRKRSHNKQFVMVFKNVTKNLVARQVIFQIFGNINNNRL